MRCICLIFMTKSERVHGKNAEIEIQNIISDLASSECLKTCELFISMHTFIYATVNPFSVAGFVNMKAFIHTQSIQIQTTRTSRIYGVEYNIFCMQLTLKTILLFIRIHKICISDSSIYILLVFIVSDFECFLFIIKTSC